LFLSKVKGVKKMSTVLHPTFPPTVGLPEREAAFPLQEQWGSPASSGETKPAAAVLSERAAEGGTALAAPVFIP
jgi:hypothetical protein